MGRALRSNLRGHQFEAGSIHYIALRFLEDDEGNVFLLKNIYLFTYPLTSSLNIYSLNCVEAEGVCQKGHLHHQLQPIKPYFASSNSRHSLVRRISGYKDGLFPHLISSSFG